MKIINWKKNATPHLKKHCTIIDDISFVVIRSCFSETNLVCDSNPVFIDILDSLFHSLFTFLSFDFYLYFYLYKFIQCLYAFFVKASKVLMRFNILLARLSSSKCPCVLFSIKSSYLLTWNCC